MSDDRDEGAHKRITVEDPVEILQKPKSVEIVKGRRLPPGSTRKGRRNDGDEGDEDR